MATYEVNCEQCGKTFKARRAKGTRPPRFCSMACYAANGGMAKNSPFKEGRTGKRTSRYRVYLGRIDGKPKYMPRSHWVWNQHHPDDPVQPGEHVHHVDHDKLNDDISNLQKLSAGNHAALHAREIVNHERSRRMRAYHAANPGKHRKGESRICPVCGSEFYRSPSASAVTCSYRCSGTWTAQRRRKHG